jgi:hypothetical protein
MSIDLRVLARRGAQLRLAELVTEMDSLLQAFPDLGKALARPGRPTKGRRLSEETKGKMRAAWAKRRRTDEDQPGAEMPAATAHAAPKLKRTMSVEARARISAAQKKRWRVKKAGKKR